MPGVVGCVLAVVDVDGHTHGGVIGDIFVRSCPISTVFASSLSISSVSALSICIVTVERLISKEASVFSMFVVSLSASSVCSSLEYFCDLVCADMSAAEDSDGCVFKFSDPVIFFDWKVSVLPSVGLSESHL